MQADRDVSYGGEENGEGEPFFQEKEGFPLALPLLRKLLCRASARLFSAKTHAARPSLRGADGEKCSFPFRKGVQGENSFLFLKRKGFSPWRFSPKKRCFANLSPGFFRKDARAARTSL